MTHIIIGTAGHVDHGKTELIRALTGYETDRLREEKTRGISIELGFAPFDLPDGRRAGVVDVPGHERFVHHMLAGVPGFDLVLLVVAADEGVMPQTREHLDILNLLGVQHGILVLTKKDLVADAELLDLVEEELRDEVRGTFLEQAPLHRVSAVTGQGIPELLGAISTQTASLPSRKVEGPCRLPIDRSFSLPGLGTVITGTLLSGQVREGQAAEIVPGRIGCRLRRLQTHGEDVELAEAGQRVAANLSGVSVNQARRGRVVAEPGSVPETQMLDAKVHLLARSPRPLQHRSRIRFHVGTAEVMGRVSLLDQDELPPGQAGWAQFRLEQPVATQRGDRFVIRFYSPVFTMGGGWVVEPQAPRRKRKHQSTLEELQLKSKGDPEELAVQALREAGIQGLTAEQLAARMDATTGQTTATLQELQQRGLVWNLGQDPQTFLAAEIAEDAAKQLQRKLAQYHREYPLRQGWSKETLRTRLFPQISARAFQDLVRHLEKREEVKTEREYLALAGHRVEFDQRQEKIADELEAAFAGERFAPPDPQELLAKFSDQDAPEVLRTLIEQGKLVRVAENLVFHVQAIEEAKNLLPAAADSEGAISVSDYRQVLGTSRKYALPLLEFFDTHKITRRVGDKRVMGRRSSS